MASRRPSTLAALALATYRTGTGDEREIARLLREIGASPAESAALLAASAAGIDPHPVLRTAYAPGEIERWDQPVPVTPAA